MNDKIPLRVANRISEYIEAYSQLPLGLKNRIEKLVDIAQDSLEKLEDESPEIYEERRQPLCKLWKLIYWFRAMIDVCKGKE